MANESKKKENKVNSKGAKEKRHFLKDVKAELKKVIWPTPKQLVNNTIAVIVVVLLVGVIVFLLDLCFEKLNSVGVEGLKAIVQSTEDGNTTENEEVSEDDGTSQDEEPSEDGSESQGEEVSTEDTNGESEGETIVEVQESEE